MESKVKVYRKRAAAILFAALLCVATAAAVRAASAAPGSEEDPVVTKSYVDKRIAELGGVFVPVEIAAGQQLIGGAGAEIILRSGEAAIISNESNGVSDLTGGLDLMTGAPVQPNHLLLVPRADGRGLTARGDVWVMVRGPYTIQ
ncbi:MAG: hypothetical protein LBD95_01790 [Clostridiales Family XIII bacterium]|jgi:hypothetical protein|nr:hypothetical protein [Clostridiales Family XIII bacterium]